MSEIAFSQEEDRVEEVRKMELINTWHSRLSFVKRHMMETLSDGEDYGGDYQVNIDYQVNMAMMSGLEDYLDYELKNSHKHKALTSYVYKIKSKIKSNSRSQKIVTDCLLALEYNHLQRLTEHYAQIDIVENWYLVYNAHKTQEGTWSPPYKWMYDEDGKLKNEYEVMINNAHAILA